MGNDEIINGKNSRTFKERKEMVNVEKEERKLTYGIRGKLISAVAMLLVAMIMVVSSTYAWFTLSTAPEVKGISTAVGANGALEMLLATKNEQGWVYEDYKGTEIPRDYKRNNYWGNLVDLSDAHYGAGLISLYPSNLNTNSGKIVNTSPLLTPQYGEDGRVQELATGGTFGILGDNQTTFMPAGANDFGFRALGVASGLTTRQKAFQSSKSALAVAAGNAQSEARSTLVNNGSALASIAVRKGLGGDSFDADDLVAVKAMIAGVKAALVDVDTALAEAMIAYAWSGLEVAPAVISSYSDAVAEVFAGGLRVAADAAAEGQKLAAVVAKANELAEANGFGSGFNSTTILGNMYTTYTQAVADVTAAETAANTLTGDSFTWAQISVPLKYLVNVTPAAGETGLLINNMTVEEVRTDEGKGKLAAAAMGGEGIQVSMPSGSGVFADVAELCGNYTVDITLGGDDLAGAGVSLPETTKIPAKMKTAVTNPKQIDTFSTGLKPAPAATENSTNPITEFYGYVIDLAFRTNAASSNLLLQTTPVDRIYENNQADAVTFGAGSTMTFSSTELTHTQIRNLMSNLRVVFFDTADYTILAEAKLDTAEANTKVDTETNGVVANLYLYGTDGALITKQDDAVITALNQNVAKHVSALVYLDGTKIQNKDVAATAAESMRGTLNLQFSSSANLNPMDYADLHNPAANSSQAASN